MSVITVKNKITGAQESLVIEITESREKLVGDSYQASLAHPVETINAYKQSTKIALDWRLKTSIPTAKGSSSIDVCGLDLGDAVDTPAVGKEYDYANAFTPKTVIITGETKEETELFNKYFTVTSISQDVTQNKNANTKEWSFDLVAKTDNLSDPDKAEVTKLLQDEIKSLDNLNVTLLVGNKISKKTFAIDAGKLSLKVDYKKPKLKFDTLTVNSAFTKDAYYELYIYDSIIGTHAIYPAVIKSKNLETLAGQTDYSITDVSFTSSYATEDFDIKYTTSGVELAYLGPAKNKSVKLPISVKLDGYVGYFDSTLPVKIKATFPVVSLTTNKAVIPEDAGEYYNIPIGFSAKNAESIGTIAKVEVVGNDDFKVVGGENPSQILYDSKNATFANNGKINGYKTGDNDLYLQPQKAVTKNTQVKLRVTFNNTKNKGGKTYSETFMFTVSPIKQNKFSFKADTKKSQALKVILSENQTVDFEKSTYCALIKLDMNPSNYKDGYITVSSEDNKLDIVSVNRLQKSFVVKAGPALKGTDKNAKVYVNWYSANNTQLGKKDTPVIVTIKPVKEFGTVKIADVNMNINKSKPANYDKLEYEYSRSTDADYAYWTMWVKHYGTKLKITNPDKYELDYQKKWANTFKVVDNGAFAIVEMNNNLYVVPRSLALKAGKIVPGAEYSLTVPFTDGYNNHTNVTFKVKIDKIKKVKAALASNTPAELSGITGYAHTQILNLHTIQPWYGVGIKSVTIADKDSPFEIIYDWREATNGITENKVVNRTATDYYFYFRLGYKGSMLPEKLAKSYKVKLNVEYTNDTTGTVTIPVKIK